MAMTGRGPQRELSVAVVIPTYNRADRVRDCLAHLRAQTTPPDRIVVVDSSPDRHTEKVVHDFPASCTPETRWAAAGLRVTPDRVSLTTEEIVAFLDDDANARPDWLEQLRGRMSTPAWAASAAVPSTESRASAVRAPIRSDSCWPMAE